MKSSQEIFSKVREVKIEARADFRARVLGALPQVQKGFWNDLRLWQGLAFLTLVALVVVSSLYYENLQRDSLRPNASYVIHVDFSKEDIGAVVRAEVELPQNVRFVSKSLNLENVKKLRLPVKVSDSGTNRLPFVVAADRAGEESITVRLLNEKDEVIREQTMKIRFAKNDGSKLL